MAKLTAASICFLFGSVTLSEVVGMVQDNGTRGNPVCWSGGYDYVACCGSQEKAKANGCWNLFFTYETCCLEPYKPTARCEKAANAEEQLWHCRMRPHWQTQRCFQAEESEELHELRVQTLYTGNYRRYQELQQEKASREIGMRFISQRAAEVVALYVARSGSGSAFVPLSGLCHGAKTGAEVRLIREALKRHGVLSTILGTDITPEAAAASGGDVILLDFHRRDERLGLKNWDFVYSNTLDHSYNPLKALRAWREQLRDSESLLILQHSDNHLSIMAKYSLSRLNTF